MSKEYHNDDLTVIWKPDICIHAAVCVDKLPKVYNPNNKPWISIDKATTEELIDQINRCPSGALTYKIKNNNIKQKETMKDSKVAGTSPMMVDLESGKSYAWCACGHSSKQPWCDGSHKGTGISPTIFKAEDNKKAAMCMCKKTGNTPHCDGAHSKIG